MRLLYLCKCDTDDIADTFISQGIQPDKQKKPQKAALEMGGIEPPSEYVKQVPLQV